ncbi:hypothetical protein PG989_012077 [Apiospora arundinis]
MASNSVRDVRAFGSSRLHVGNSYSDSSETNYNITVGLGHLSIQTPSVCRYFPYQRNQQLVERPDIVEKLNNILPVSTDYHGATLWGLGGTGKTQIALAYAYNRCEDHDCSVFWVNADNETTFKQDYRSIGIRLGLVTEMNGDDFLHNVRAKMEASPKWVLVLDNADCLDLFGITRLPQEAPPSHGPTTINLRDYIPHGPTGTVLWTSRDRQIMTVVGPAQAIQVTQMTHEEAVTLFENFRGIKVHGEEREYVEKLLEELGRFPLAISQAASYMRETSTSPGEYLADIQEKSDRWEILGNSEPDCHRRPDVSNSILATWGISINRIRQDDILAYNVLCVLAFTDNQNIPFDLAREAASSCATDYGRVSPTTRDKPRRRADESKIRFRKAITRLEQHSFLHSLIGDGSAQTRAYEMHKLLQEAARYHLRSIGRDQSKDLYFARAAFEATNKLFPQYSDHHYHDVYGRENWAECEKYLAHVLQTAKWAGLQDGHLEVADLLMRASTYLSERGRWMEKLLIEQKATKLRQTVLGSRHRLTTLSIWAQVNSYAEIGDYRTAEKICREVFLLQKELLGDRDKDTLRSLETLAAIHSIQWRCEEVQKVPIYLLELRREILGDRHPDTIYSMSVLATTYHYQKRYAEAENLMVDVVKLRRKVLGSKNPCTISSMASLAAIYHEQGRYAASENLEMEVLELQREVLSDNHPATMSRMSQLAVTYCLQKKYTKAEAMIVDALERQSKGLGQKHPDTVRSLSHLGLIYSSQGRLTEAERIEVEVLKLRREVRGERHPDTMDAMKKLAWTYGKQGLEAKREEIIKELTNLEGEVQRATLEATTEMIAMMGENTD